MSKNAKIGLIILLILIVGLILSVVLSRQTVNTQQHAAQAVNINTSKDITDTRNKDLSMGPQNSSGNYSNRLSKDVLGSITFSITDPSAGQPTFPQKIPTVTPDFNAPSVSVSPVANGPQKVKSLVVKISKIEVHLNATKLNGNVNAWETLNLQTPMSVDIAQLVDGAVVNFSLTKLAEGNYDEVRLYITGAQATLQNGQIVMLEIPGKNGIIRVVKDFVVEKGRNTNLILDIDAQQSVNGLENKYVFNPYVVNLDINK